MTREQARERVLDYAYGELSATEAEAFEAILSKLARLVVLGFSDAIGVKQYRLARLQPDSIRRVTRSIEYSRDEAFFHREEIVSAVRAE